MSGRALILLLLALACVPNSAFAQALLPRHALTIDDVLETQRIDRATLSPDGAWVAAVVMRPARPNEAYGRVSYETDPSRSDIWLTSTRTGEKRAITHGAPRAAGYWCATWSPDGQRLAFLSTQPEGREPRGGDNVRLYVWERASGTVRRMSNAAVMTQMRYGSGVDRLDLRGGADHGMIAHDCGADENAPFLWLGNHRLLVATLPAGQVSGLLDQYSRPFREDARNAALILGGAVPTVRAVGSGAARQPRDPNNSAILQTLDVTTRATRTIAPVPIYPFRSELAVSVSPDGRRLAILATIGALAPRAGLNFPHAQEDAWTVERRLGFADLASEGSLRWITMPAEGRYPLDLYAWSPDSRRVALRARSDSFATETPLFVATVDGSVRRLGSASVGEERSGDASLRQAPVLWLDKDRLVARLTGSAAKPASAWWVLDVNGAAVELAHAADPFPSQLHRAADGHLIGIAGEKLVRLDLVRKAFVPVATLTGGAAIVWPVDPDAPAAQFLVSVSGKDGEAVRALEADGTLGPLFQPPGLRIAVSDLVHGTLLWSQASAQGLVLDATRLADTTSHDILRLDGFLANVAWGHSEIIDYADAEGKPLKGIMILPPDYQPGHRYPTLVWVYDGYVVYGLDDYWTDPFMPGIYNLQLYAAHGYVVLVPSMPDAHDAGGVYANVPKGAMPAIDRLIAMGIADPNRLGVFGQSFGGYSTYALVSQTNRFKAAVGIAGISDLTSNYGTFDPAARGYPGIEHEKSENWSIGQGGPALPPPEGAAAYARDSPLSYANRIDTPLLLIHGEFDGRGASVQAEELFTALYRRGKTAKLLRYGGESHSLAQSPANVRDVYAQTLDWFDSYLRTQEHVQKAKPDPH